MRTTLYLIIICLSFGFSVDAQTLSPEIITSYGGTGIYNDINIDWTLGEIGTNTYIDHDRIVTQGFQQPILKVAYSDAFVRTPSLDVNVYPNPVQEKLSVAFESNDDSKIIMNVTDMFGKKLMMSVSSTQMGIKELDFSAFHPGVYLLTILKTTGETINTFRITKVL